MARPAWLALDNAEIRGAGDYGILGILNLDPASFYDGGKYQDVFSHGRHLLAAGAHVLDLGAESSRPGSRPLPPGVEKARLAPVLAFFAKLLPPARISVDTWHPDTAAYVLENGAGIINDVSGCLWDGALLEVVGAFRPGYVLTHSQGLPETMQARPRYGDIVSELQSFFEGRLAALTSAGLPETHIALDPGIGFGKNAQHNLAILANLDKLLIFGRPLLLGISMKSFFQDVLGLPLAKREAITAVAAALAWQQGVFWHRVHRPELVCKSLELAAALRIHKESPGPR